MGRSRLNAARGLALWFVHQQVSMDRFAPLPAMAMLREPDIELVRQTHPIVLLADVGGTSYENLWRATRALHLPFRRLALDLCGCAELTPDDERPLCV